MTAWAVWRRPLCGRHAPWEKMPGAYPTRALAFQAVGALELRAGVGEWSYTIWPEGQTPAAAPSPPRYMTREMRPL